MWRTGTSAPRSPVRRMPSLPASTRPTRVARTASIACSGASSDTSQVGQQHVERGLAIERQQQVAVGLGDLAFARDRLAALGHASTSRTPSPNTTPDRPPENTPPTAPWPRMLPLPPIANCSEPTRPEDRPPNR